MTACKGCIHSQRQQIDLDLVANVPFRQIVAYSGMSLGSLSRHKDHVKRELARAYNARESAGSEQAGELLNRVNHLLNEAQGVLAHAKESKDLKACVAAIGALTRVLELYGRSSGELQPSGGLHLHQTRITNNTLNVAGCDDEIQLAKLICEGTNGWDETRIAELKQLAAGPV
jgi:hypothetical protein